MIKWRAARPRPARCIPFRGEASLAIGVTEGVFSPLLDGATVATLSVLEASEVACPEEVSVTVATEVEAVGQPSQELTVTDTSTPEGPELEGLTPEGVSTGFPGLDGATLGQPGQALTVTSTPVPGTLLVVCSAGVVGASGVIEGFPTEVIIVVGTG